KHRIRIARTRRPNHNTGIEQAEDSVLCIISYLWWEGGQFFQEVERIPTRKGTKQGWKEVELRREGVSRTRNRRNPNSYL
ncbi:unnamed protein product, partial [Linum tenue]